MKKYNTPELEIVEIDNDVITTSVNTGMAGPNETDITTERNDWWS